MTQKESTVLCVFNTAKAVVSSLGEDMSVPSNHWLAVMTSDTVLSYI